MKRSGYMDMALRRSDPRYARILGKLGYSTRDMRSADQAVVPVNSDNDLADLRDEYQQFVGKRPFHGWDAPTLREKIAEAKG